MATCRVCDGRRIIGHPNEGERCRACKGAGVVAQADGIATKAPTKAPAKAELVAIAERFRDPGFREAYNSLTAEEARKMTAPTREQQLEEALRTIVDSLDLDCGDNSCRFARERKGMRTNGGCRCIESRKPGVVSRIAFARREALALLDGGVGWER